MDVCCSCVRPKSVWAETSDHMYHTDSVPPKQNLLVIRVATGFSWYSPPPPGFFKILIFFLFFLNCRPFTPPPVWMVRPVHFLATSLTLKALALLDVDSQLFFWCLFNPSIPTNLAWHIWHWYGLWEGGNKNQSKLELKKRNFSSFRQMKIRVNVKKKNRFDDHHKLRKKSEFTIRK